MCVCWCVRAFMRARVRACMCKCVCVYTGYVLGSQNRQFYGLPYLYEAGQNNFIAMSSKIARYF